MPKYLSIGRLTRGVVVVKLIALSVFFGLVVLLVSGPLRIGVSGGLKVSRREIHYPMNNTSQRHLPPKALSLPGETVHLQMAQLRNFLPNVFLHPGSREDSERYRSSVLAYLHNPKSGGTSMRQCLEELSQDAGKPPPVLVSIDTISEVTTRHLNKAIKVSDFYVGDASFGICDSVDGRPCSYFALMREPFERSISHYFFCRSGGESWPPCNNTLEEFTLSLCSLFFRQMTTRLSCDHVVKSNASSPWTCNNRATSIDHYIHKNARNRAATLEYILANMDEYFAVIGIVDEFETSLKLFEHAFGYPFHRTCNDIQLNRARYTDGDKERIYAESKARLMQNEKVRECLHEDIQIYEQVLRIFETEKHIFANL